MPRLYRGVTHKFGAAFFEDPERAYPITPIDSNYPLYEIRSPSNILVTSGTATQAAGPGFWETNPWTVPMDAELSTPERGVSQPTLANNVPDGTARFWRVDWLIVDSAGRNSQWSETFEVLPLPATVSSDRSQIIAVPVGAKQRVILRSKVAYDSIQVTIANALSPTSFIHDVDTVANLDLGDPQDLDIINRQLDGETFVYWFEVPASTFVLESDFQVMWTTKIDSGFEFDYIHDQIYCFDRKWLNYFKPLRMVIDRLQKQADTYQAYTQADLLEYLRRGLDTLSAWHPSNITWNITSFPGGMMSPYLIVAAAIWGLQAQYLLEGELQANFSGQTVTLDYDHSGAIDGMLQKMQDFMNGTGQNGFQAVKQAWYRRSTPVGYIGVRPTRYSGFGNVVYRTGTAQDLESAVSTLNGLGLLP